MNQRTVMLAFGLVVRVFGLWTSLQGLQLIIGGLTAASDGRPFVLGVLTALLGLGILRYAEKLVRFSYPDVHQEID